MKEIKASIYPFPWSVNDFDQRIALVEGREVNLFKFFGSPVILVPEGANIFLGSKSTPLPQLGPTIKDKGRLIEVPQGFLTTNETTIKLTVKEGSSQTKLSVLSEGAIQPPPLNDKNIDNVENYYDSISLLRLISSWVDIINEIFDSGYDGSEKHPPITWEKIAELLLNEKNRKDKPRMALIIKIAREMKEKIREIAFNPRKILLRGRQLQRLERIQEIDSACLRWIAHQPGRTIPEKAESKQQLLAVVRNETYDTLENRVFKDFLKRCKQVAASYLDDQRQFYKSDRFNDVNSYKILCEKLLEYPLISNVQKINRLVQPNYVLQSGKRYRKVWEWYQKLLRQDQEIDNAWAWQSRLWVDISKILVSIALTVKSDNNLLNIKPIAKSDAKFRTEQLCGSWLISNSMPGPCWFEHDNKRLIIETVDSFHAHKHNICRHLGILGGHYYVLITDIHSQKQVVVVFWGIHGASSVKLPNVKDIVTSASKSLSGNYLMLKEKLHPVPAMTGCVLISTMNDNKEESYSEDQNSKAYAMSLPANPGKWHDAIELIQIFLVEALDLL